MRDEITHKDRMEIVEILCEFGSWKYEGDMNDLVLLYRAEGLDAIKAAVEWTPKPKLF